MQRGLRAVAAAAAAVGALGVLLSVAVPALAQQQCWEGTAPSCLSPYVYNEPVPPDYDRLWSQWNANRQSELANPNYAPFANSSHAYINNPH